MNNLSADSKGATGKVPFCKYAKTLQRHWCPMTMRRERSWRYEKMEIGGRSEDGCSLRASSHLSDRTDTGPTAGTGFCLPRPLLWRLYWIQNVGMHSLFLNSSLWRVMIYHATCKLCLCERSSQPMMYKWVCHCVWVLQWHEHTNEAESSSWRLLCVCVCSCTRYLHFPLAKWEHFWEIGMFWPTLTG